MTDIVYNPIPSVYIYHLTEELFIEAGLAWGYRNSKALNRIDVWNEPGQREVLKC